MRLSVFKAEVEKLGYWVDDDTHWNHLCVMTREDREIAVISKSEHCRMCFQPASNVKLNPIDRQRLFKLCYQFANTTIVSR